MPKMHLSGYLIIPALVLVFFSTLESPIAYDLWYYLRMGQEIWERGAIPHDTNFLALPGQIPRGYDINPEWGFCLLVFQIFQLGAETGLAVAKSLILVALFAFTYGACRSTGLHPVPSLLWVSLGLWMIRGRFMLRTALLTDLLLAILVFVLLRAGHERRLGLPWVVLPFFVLWANLHPGVLAGVILLAALTTGELVQSRLASYKPALPWSVLAWATGLAFLATFLRPGGWRVYQFTWDLMFKRVVHKSLVVEMTPLADTWWRDSVGLFLAVVALSVLLSWLARKPRLSHLLVIIAFTFLAFRHNRAVGELYPTAGPLAAAAFMSAWPWLQAKLARFKLSRAKKLETPVSALLLLLISGLLYQSLTRQGAFDFQLRASIYPLETMEYLKEHPQPGILFNSYEFGGILAWNGFKPFIHGMTGTYGDELIRHHLDILASATKREDLLEQLGVSTCLLHYPNEEDSHRDFLAYLWSHPQWQLLTWDDASMLFTRNPAPTEPYKAVMPSLEDPFPLGPGEQARAELERYLKSYPQLSKGWLLLGELHLRNQNLAEAETSLGRALDNNPRLYEALLKRGSVRFQLGNTQGALDDLKQAVELAPLSPVARFNLATALVRSAQENPSQEEGLSQLEEARDELERALELQADFPAAQQLLERLP